MTRYLFGSESRDFNREERQICFYNFITLGVTFVYKDNQVSILKYF